MPSWNFSYSGILMRPLYSSPHCLFPPTVPWDKWHKMSFTSTKQWCHITEVKLIIRSLMLWYKNVFFLPVKLVFFAIHRTDRLFWCNVIAVRKCLTSRVVRWHRQKQSISRTRCAVNLHRYLNSASLSWSIPSSTFTQLISRCQVL